MENIKNNTQPSVEALEKLSLEGLSDDTIKLLALYLQMLRTNKEIDKILSKTSNHVPKSFKFDFSGYNDHIRYIVTSRMTIDLTGYC